MLHGFLRLISGARRTLAGLAILLALGVPSLAGSLEDCANDKLDIAKRIAACKSAIEDKATTPSNRALAFFNRANALADMGAYDLAIADYGDGCRSSATARAGASNSGPKSIGSACRYEWKWFSIGCESSADQ